MASFISIRGESALSADCLCWFWLSIICKCWWIKGFLKLAQFLILCLPRAVWPDSGEFGIRIWGWSALVILRSVCNLLKWQEKLNLVKVRWWFSEYSNWSSTWYCPIYRSLVSDSEKIPCILAQIERNGTLLLGLVMGSPSAPNLGILGQRCFLIRKSDIGAVATILLGLLHLLFWIRSGIARADSRTKEIFFSTYCWFWYWGRNRHPYCQCHLRQVKKNLLIGLTSRKKRPN